MLTCVFSDGIPRRRFSVTLVHSNVQLDGTRFVLRWPGVLQEHSAVTGCTVVQVEPINGLLVVVPVVGAAGSVSFSVSGRWK